MTNARLAPLLASALLACGGAPAATPQPPPAPAPSATPAPPAASAAPASAPLPLAAMGSATDVLAHARASFDPCYAKARAARPDVGRTTVSITFHVEDTGKPMTVNLEYNRKWDESAKECMRAAALDLSFPPDLRGKQVGTIDFAPPQ